MYGPSGCGKSSLVKAGLLPRLDDRVVRVYLEATGDGTEPQLLGALRKRWPNLPDGLNLAETCVALRDGSALPAGTKLLIVIDQFEQWLHGRSEEDYTLLAEALRECDGGRLQCLLLIRDDFWTQLTRFLQQIQMRLADGKNAAMVDLFDKQHAKKVLTLFGRALEKLPKHGDLSPDQQPFVDAAVDELAEDGRVVCVKLALFAEIARRSDWTPGTLREMGGMQGLGVLFLQESLSGEHAPPGRRRHVRAAEGCLKLLLPAKGSKVKGKLRTREELQQASGYADRPDDFAELLEILDRELRLVTASRPEDQTSGTASLEFAPDQGLLYRLTHDYLVPSVRQWLEQNRRGREKHWQGRAELRLEELTDQWQVARDRRFLPGPIEFLLILLGVPWKRYQPQQRRLMRAASGWYGAFAVVGVLALACVWWGVREGRGRADAPAIVQRLIDTADNDRTSEFLRILAEEANSYRPWVRRGLRIWVEEQPEDSYTETQRVKLGKQRADAAIAMWQLGDPERATDVLKVDKDPESLTQFVHRCKERGVRAVDLWDQLLKADETTVRYGLLLALGEFNREEIPDPQREQWVKTLADWYANDPKSAIHSASGWLLRHWGETQRVEEVDRRPLAYDPQREWFVVKVKYGEEAEAAADYFTFIVFPPGKFLMGSPPHEAGRDDDEDLREVEIEQLFALCDREITNAQYNRFLASKNADAGDESGSRIPAPSRERVVE
jgi:hypothetical protein